MLNFGWFYVLCVTGYLAFVIHLFFSPYGGLTLGKPNDTPDYGYTTWFGMLFSAGMGIGLMFFGVAEPVSHYMARIPLGDACLGHLRPDRRRGRHHGGLRHDVMFYWGW